MSPRHEFAPEGGNVSQSVVGRLLSRTEDSQHVISITPASAMFRDAFLLRRTQWKKLHTCIEMSHCLHFRPDIFAENQLYIRSLSLPDFKERNLRGNTPVTLTNTGCEHVIAHIELGAIFEPGVPTCPTSHVHIALVVAA